MTNWQYYLLAGLAAVLLAALAIRSAVIKKRKQKQRDFDRKLGTVLRPKEEVKVIAADKNGRCILTSERLLFDTKDGFTAVPFTKIKSLSGVTAEGKKTTSPARMAVLTIKAGQEFTLHNQSEAFVELVKQLKTRTAKKKKTKKPAGTGPA